MNISFGAIFIVVVTSFVLPVHAIDVTRRQTLIGGLAGFVKANTPSIPLPALATPVVEAAVPAALAPSMAQISLAGLTEMRAIVPIPHNLKHSPTHAEERAIRNRDIPLERRSDSRLGYALGTYDGAEVIRDWATENPELSSEIQPLLDVYFQHIDSNELIKLYTQSFTQQHGNIPEQLENELRLRMRKAPWVQLNLDTLQNYRYAKIQVEIGTELGLDHFQVFKAIDFLNNSNYSWVLDYNEDLDFSRLKEIEELYSTKLEKLLPETAARYAEMKHYETEVYVNFREQLNKGLKTSEYDYTDEVFKARRAIRDLDFWAAYFPKIESKSEVLMPMMPFQTLHNRDRNFTPESKAIAMKLFNPSPKDPFTRADYEQIKLNYQFAFEHLKKQIEVLERQPEHWKRNEILKTYQLIERKMKFEFLTLPQRLNRFFQIEAERQHKLDLIHARNEAARNGVATTEVEDISSDVSQVVDTSKLLAQGFSLLKAQDWVNELTTLGYRAEKLGNISLELLETWTPDQPEMLALEDHSEDAIPMAEITTCEEALVTAGTEAGQN